MQVNFKAMQKELESMLDQIDEIIKNQEIKISENDDGSVEHAEKLNDLEMHNLLNLDEDIKDEILELFAENYFLMCSFTNLIEE